MREIKLLICILCLFLLIPFCAYSGTRLGKGNVLVSNEVAEIKKGKRNEKETEYIDLLYDAQNSQEDDDIPGDAKEQKSNFENSSLEVDEWINKIPAEIWCYILSQENLCYGQRRNVQLVSKGFRELVRGTWTQKEIGFCKKYYKNEPWKLTEIPILEVQASELESCILYAHLVWGIDVPDATNETLKLLNKFSNLIILNLWFSKIRDVGLKHLSNLQNLTTLYLGGTKITDVGLKHLSNLQNLTKLNLGSTKITDFSTLKDLHKLTELDLSRCRNIVDLSALKNFSNLAELSLSHTNITDSDLEHISKLENLTALNLGGTYITDAGLQPLPQGLTILYLDECSKITDAGLADLRSRLPNLKIIQ